MLVDGSGRTRAFGYIRVSTEEQHLGAEAQRKAILDFASRQGIEVVKFYEDLGISGGIPAFKRQGFRRMIEDARSSGVSVIIVYAIDRLGRSFYDIFSVLKSLEESGVHVLSVRERFLQTMEPMIRSLVLMVLAWAAEYERFLIRERTRQALAAKGVRHAVEVPREKREAVLALYKAGYGIKRIAKMLSISERQVKKVLVQEGVIQLPPDTCPRCFAKMKYDPQYQTLVCPNCGYVKR